MLADSPALSFDSDSHTYRLDGVVIPSVSQIIRGAGLVDVGRFTDDSRAFGTNVHAACQFYDEGDLDEESLHPDLALRLRGWIKFSEEMAPRLGRCFAIEKRFWCRAPSGMLYAGTVDRAYIDDAGNVTIIDIKTGRQIPSYALQTAAYAHAFKANRRACVQLTPSGGYRWVEHSDRSDIDGFFGALAVYTWLSRNGGLRG